MGYKFSPEEKEQLLATGNLGKTIEVTPKNGEPFSAYVSIDPQTNEIIALRADRVNIPKEIKGVTLSDAQYKDLVEGKAVRGSKANSSWLRWAFPLRIIYPIRRMPLP